MQRAMTQILNSALHQWFKCYLQVMVTKCVYEMTVSESKTCAFGSFRSDMINRVAWLVLVVLLGVRLNLLVQLFTSYLLTVCVWC